MGVWNVNDKEFAAVIALEPPKRYGYFVKRVADWGSVWGLWSEGGWALAADDEGTQALPVWPHPRYAAACACEHWSGSEPREISLADWMDKWLPGMLRDGTAVAVFPTPNNKGPLVSPERVAEDLRSELELFE